MTKPSASTLARRARTAKTTKEAKRLRAEAAKMRRDARKPHPLVQQRVDRQMAELDRIAASVDAMPLTQNGLSGTSQSLGEQPGHGEIVGGRLSLAAEQFASLARKKGGVDEIQRRLSTMEAVARYEGGTAAEARVLKVAKESNERWRENIVTGFIARCETLEALNRGLPKTVVVDGVTLARVIAALKASGYTADGKR